MIEAIVGGIIFVILAWWYLRRYHNEDEDEFVIEWHDPSDPDDRDWLL